jgi:cell fate (sporulation/competence/biofilm development) regulator YlbF (YheA/YmcA/DUF963 family)
MNPYDHAHELARALRSSAPYKAMQEAKGHLDGDPQAARMLMDFHMKQLEFEQRRLLGQTDDPAAEESLRKLYDILQLHPHVRDYLRAEYELGVLFQDVQKILGDVLQEVALAGEGARGDDASSD